MKRIIMTFFILFFSGCIPVIQKNYTIMEIKNATVGSQMVGYESTTAVLFEKSGYKWELVYAGIDRRTLQVDYREYFYSNNSWLIKDGFTQHLKYDISESEFIVFKTFELEIIEANSSWIKFRVTRDDVSASTPSESSNFLSDETTKPFSLNVNSKANFSEPEVDINTEDMKDIEEELVEDEKPTYIAIKKVLNKYILLYQGKETPMVIEDEYPIVRGIGSGKFLTIGTAKVVKIKGSAVALKPSLERRYQPVTILDKIEYMQKVTNDN